MIEPPETQYAKMADGGYIAYQVVGEGDLDLVFIPLGASHLELAWEVPAFARVFERLASFTRLIRLDHRSTGLSDPLAHGESPSVEGRANEVLAVLDAVGSERVTLLANNTSGLAALYVAAANPNRVASLVLDGCYARLAWAPDYPFGVPTDALDRSVIRVNDARVQADAVEFAGLRYQAPSLLDDAEFVSKWRWFHRHTSSPAAAGAETEMVVFADVRAVLPAVQAPTLVLYRRDDLFAGRPYAEYLAEHIAGAKLVELPGRDNLMFVGDFDADVDEIEEFLTGARHAPATDRVLATVLFTDIVGSTERAAQLGDRRWREVLDAHDRAVRRQLERYRGREVNTAGDGFLATFDGPGRAIECGGAIRDALRALGLEVRVGVHTGEIEIRGADVAGMAVHIGARVAALAGASEVLVSSTVKDLVAGSGMQFGDRGEHELKGVPGAWRLYAVVG